MKRRFGISLTLLALGISSVSQLAISSLPALACPLPLSASSGVISRANAGVPAGSNRIRAHFENRASVNRRNFLYWPTGRPVPVPRRFDPPAQRWLRGHRGIDLRVSPGETVYAATDGTVLYAGNLAGRPVISLEDDTGRRYTYEPANALVSKGDPVVRGEPIGIALGGHYPGDDRLHFGVKDGPDGYVDPLKLLGGRVRLWPGS